MVEGLNTAKILNRGVLAITLPWLIQNIDVVSLFMKLKLF